MVKSKFIALLTVYCISAFASSAQINRYMVFFDGKDISNYSVDNPEAFLSERAITRRNKYNIPVTSQDLPVVSLYVDLIGSIQDVSVFHKTRWLNGVLIEADESQVPVIEDLAFVTDVRFVAPGQRFKPVALDVSGSSTITQSSGRISEISNAIQNNMLGIDEMHAAGFTGEGKMIAVFDAGFIGTNFSSYFTRLFENNLVVATWDFVENTADIYKYDDHGTSVLSTISAYYEDVFTGIAPDSEVVLCVTEDVPTEYVIEEYNWLFAAEYADSIGVDIINTSLGYNIFDDPSMDYDYEDMNGNTAIITRATDIAASKGILCVVSVGNEGNKDWKKMVAPADADSVIAVGAVNENEEYLTFSSTGPTADLRIKPDMSALGQGTVVIGWDGLITSGSGTSYASPLIAGLAAGVWQAYPQLSNIELIELIKKGSSQYDSPDTLLGYGIPDFKAIQSEITSLEEDLSDRGFKIYPNPLKDHILFVEISESRKSRDNIEIEIFDLNGSSVFYHRAKRIKTGSRIELDLAHLASGVYILHLNAGNDYGTAKILVP